MEEVRRFLDGSRKLEDVSPDDDQYRLWYRPLIIVAFDSERFVECERKQPRCGVGGYNARGIEEDQ